MGGHSLSDIHITPVTLLLSHCWSGMLSLMRFYLCTQVIVLLERKDTSGLGALSKQPGP